MKISSTRLNRVMREARRTGFLNQSMLIIGGPGEGKNTCYEPQLASEVGRKSIWIFDRRGATGASFLQRIRGRYDHVVDEDLSRKDRVVPFVLLPATGDDQADELARERLIETCSLAPDDDLFVGPQKRYFADLACHVYQRLKPELRATIRFADFLRIFFPTDGWHYYLCDSCTDQSLIHPFAEARVLHPSTRLSTLHPTYRFLHRYAGRTAVKLRDSQRPFPVKELIEGNHVVVFRNGSSEEMQLIGSILIGQLINYFEDGGAGQARIVIDEFVSTNMVTTAVLSALRMMRKTGLSFTFIDTHLPRDPEILEALNQCCATKIVHKCPAWETATLAAQWFSGELDPYKVHHRTERQLHNGYESYKTARRSHGTVSGSSMTGAPWGQPSDDRRTRSSSTSFVTQEQDMQRALYRSVRDEHFWSLSDQVIDLAREIQNDLRRGERKIYSHGKTWKEYTPLEKPRWPWRRTLDRKLDEWLEKIRQSDFYITPNLSEPELPWRYRKLFANGKPSTGSGRTHRHTKSSKKSGATAPSKRPGGRRSNGKNGNASNT